MLRHRMAHDGVHVSRPQSAKGRGGSRWPGWQLEQGFRKYEDLKAALDANFDRQEEARPPSRLTPIRRRDVLTTDSCMDNAPNAERGMGSHADG